MPFKYVEFMTQLTTPGPVRLDDSFQEPDILSGYEKILLFYFSTTIGTPPPQN